MDPQAIGLGHFLAHADGVGLDSRRVARHVGGDVVSHRHQVDPGLVLGAARRAFWRHSGTRRRCSVAAQLEQQHPDEPFSHLAWHGDRRGAPHQRHGANRLDESGSTAEFLTRAMRRVIDEETARFESGLTVLASIGSTAPFIGLFGTVWGVYHALVAIGMSGQGTLDKVAGPVGEALIMTALGLAVAIPAVLAYNFACAATAWCSRSSTRSRTICSRCSRPART